MEKAFQEEMKEKLMEEKKLLTKDLSGVSIPDVGDHVPGENAPKFPNYGDDNLGENTESPAEVAEFEVNVSVTGRLEQRMKEVNAALSQMEIGKYGRCKSCERTISEDRLKANPAAEKCIKCAKSHTA